MSTRETRWPTGTPSWADLMTSDRESSWAFYSTVLGWQITDSGPDMGHYGMASVGGGMVAGIGTPPDPSQAPPPAWMTYLATDDLDKTCEAITSNGGQIVAPPMDVGGSGRMALAADPTGAHFGVWRALDFIGAERVNEPGAMVWNQAMSRDPERARAFYAAVFGYEYTAMEGADFATINGDGPGNTIGGIGGMDPSVPATVPAHWDTYFMVADAEVTVAKATAAGGTVQVPAFDTEFGKMGAITDPQGATFWFMQDTSGMLDAGAAG
jgi:predicted enzyme related to lactoylglutathione lyase